MNLLKVFLFILIFVAVVGVTSFIIDWIVHIEMNEDRGKPYNWCTFKTFMKEFSKYENHPDLYVEKWGDISIFLDGADWEPIVKLHASIIEFNGICMILYPHSWLQYRIWKEKFGKNKILEYKQRGLWKCN